MADLKISQLTGATTPLAGTEVVPLVQSSSTKKIAVSDLTAGRAVSGLSFATANVTVGASAVTAGTDISYSVNSGATQKVQAGYTTGSFRPALFMYSVGANHDMVLQFTDLCRFYNAAGATQFSIDHLNSKVTTEYNIIPAAAKGINFTANTPAAGMTSQLLNWYEEGTWTPTLTTSGTDFTSVSYFPGAVNGRYTRIGNLVTIQGSMRTTAITVGSASGNLRIGGLPFTAANVAFSDSCVSVATVSGFNTNQPSGGRVVGNTTQIQLEYRTAANGVTADMGFAEANTGYNVNIINFSATYRV